MRKRRFIVGAVSLATLALALSACAKIHVACPTNGIEHAMIGGNNVGTVAITALMSMGSKAGLMAEPNRVGAAAPAPGTPNTATTVDYSYVPIFGTDYVECGQGPLPK